MGGLPLQNSGLCVFRFFFSSRRRHTRFSRDWSSDVCSSDLEHEWEVVASGRPVDGNLLERRTFHPRRADPSTHENPIRQLFGDVWEWTRSGYDPYPGYRPLSGALGEYNGKFMCDQHVLRGGSCLTSASHIRPTYRNFFYAKDRWQFSGLRLAKDASNA